jgi:hypothetical protein
MGQVFFPARLQLSPVGIVPPMRHTRIDSCTFDAIEPSVLTEIRTLPATGTLSFVKEREDVKLPYRPICLWKHNDNTSMVIIRIWLSNVICVMGWFASIGLFYISFIVWDSGLLERNGISEMKQSLNLNYNMHRIWASLGVWNSISKPSSSTVTTQLTRWCVKSKSEHWTVSRKI